MTEKSDIIIRDTTIITVDAERRVITDGAIVIEKDKIKDIGKSNELTKKYHAAKVIDGSDKLLIPGLVNTHLHFFHQLHKGVVPDNQGTLPWSNFAHSKIATVMTEEDETIGGLAGLIETLRSGTTTVLDAGSYFPGACIEGLAELGMRVVVGGRCFDQEIYKNVYTGQSSLLRTTEGCLKFNEAFVSKYKGGLANGRMTPHISLVGLGRITDKLFLESKKMADHYGVSLNFHLASTPEEVADCMGKHRERPVEHLNRLGILGKNVVLVHMIQVNDQEIKMLKENKANVSYQPATALKLAKGLSTFGRFPEMVKAGVNVCLGTDGADCANYQNMIRTMYLAAVLFKDFRRDINVMGAETAIEMATINGAQALGMESNIGSLEKGKKADVVIINMKGAEWVPHHNPMLNLVYSCSGNNVQTVIVDGNIVMEDWQIKTVNEEKILAKCQELSKKILMRGNVNPIQTIRWKVV